MANLSIFQGLLQPPKSVADYDQQAATTAGLQLQNTGRGIQNQTAQLSNQKTQTDLDRSTQLLALSKGLPQGSSDLDRLSALRNAGFYDQADALSTSLDNRSKSTAAAAKDTASAADTTNKTQNAMKEEFLKVIPMFNTPDDVKSYLAEGVLNKKLSQEQANQMVSSVPVDPAQLPAWQMKAMRMLLTPEQQTKLTTPDANAVLGAQTSTGNNAATNAAHIQGTAMTNATSRANNAATIGKDYKVAGIDPQSGNFIGAGAGPEGGGMAGMVDALGGYKLDPSQAFSRMAPAMKAGVIAEVQKKYPDYDPTTYAAKTKAARDFGSGALGNQMRSFQVGLDHLDQFGKLADALDNGNVQLINKFGNAIAAQTGNPAPTNFDAAKAIIAKEVIKSVVQGGGGVGERQEAERILDSAKTPKQLKGAITTLTNLMSAQHDALLQQRRAAGLPDSSLPKYASHASDSTPAAPAAGMFKIISVK